MQHLRTNLRQYRTSVKMTQEELAKSIGVRRETIVHLENEKYNPSLKMAMDIAKVFEVTVEDLFWFEEAGQEEYEGAKHKSSLRGNSKALV